MDQNKIGKFIMELRKENNMTQEALAEKMSVTNKSVSRWENGKTLPDLSLLVQLSEVLNITLAELIKGRRLNKDELVKQKELIENIIEYDSNRKYGYNKKAMTKLGTGLIITSLAILNNYYPFLNFVFTPNAAEFVQGFMYGIGITFELINTYKLTNDISLRERKKRVVNKIKNKF